MACRGCAKRNQKLVQFLGFEPMRVGPNHCMTHVYETPTLAVVLNPYLAVQRATTRTAILALIVRVLFGRSRSGEPPTPTEVWHLRLAGDQQGHAILYRYYARDGTDAQLRYLSNHQEAEVRRARWLRLVGPIKELEGSPVEAGLDSYEAPKEVGNRG